MHNFWPQNRPFKKVNIIRTLTELLTSKKVSVEKIDIHKLYFFLIDSSAQGNTPAASSQAQVRLTNLNSVITFVEVIMKKRLNRVVLISV